MHFRVSFAPAFRKTACGEIPIEPEMKWRCGLILSLEPACSDFRANIQRRDLLVVYRLVCSRFHRAEPTNPQKRIDQSASTEARRFGVVALHLGGAVMALQSHGRVMRATPLSLMGDQEQTCENRA
jgi:hypothetical protein